MDPSKGQNTQQQPAGQQANPVGDINKANPGFAAHQAAPGPAMMPQGTNVPMEGTKEERRAKAAEWNTKGDQDFGSDLITR